MKSDLPVIGFKLDGRDVQAIEGETILQAADRLGVEIPRLCYKDGYRPDGNCRSCVVEIAGERVLAPSCCRAPTPGMQVQARSERALRNQKMVLELLLADMPEEGYKHVPLTPALSPEGRGSVGQHGELSEWAARLDVKPREALKALRMVAAEGICGMEVVEIAPPYDTSESTAQLGCRAIMDVLGVMVRTGQLGRRSQARRDEDA